MKSRELFVKGQELERTAEAEQKSRHEIELLLRAFESFSSGLNTAEIVNHLFRYVDSAVPCHRMTVYLRRIEGFRVFRREAGTSAKRIEETVDPSSEALFQFEELREPVIIENVRQDEDHHDFPFHDDTCSAMIIPLSFQHHITGYLAVENRKDRDIFEDADVRIVQALANEAAISLENARLFQEVEKLSTTDPLTGLHNRRYFNEQARKLVGLSVINGLFRR